MQKPVSVVVGIGPKNGAAFARELHAAGYSVALVSRSMELSQKLAGELGDARAYACDAGRPEEIGTTFAAIRADLGEPEVLVFNAGSGAWKGFDETTPADLERAFAINALGFMTSAQAVLPAMRKAKHGSIIVVGATASLRGRPKTTAFAAAKAAQRSLAQSLARQFWPEGIHVSLLIVDGSIGEAGGQGGAVAGAAVKQLDPRDIARAALALVRQPSSAWSFEIDLRPKDEPW
jgi:NAD(P)-dependent dehydrogenase (short-subunit alcohol dehydrogenase family)